MVGLTSYSPRPTASSLAMPNLNTAPVVMGAARIRFREEWSAAACGTAARRRGVIVSGGQ